MRESTSSAQHPVLVVGGGVAGMQAALDLAGLGLPVFLAEQQGHLGGQALRLDKVYPTDHCAFCPTWTQAKACREHPAITVATRTRFAGTERDDAGETAVLTRMPQVIDPENCIFCGKCIESCPKGALGRRASDLPWDPAAPPLPHFEPERCDGCERCVAVCPTRAVDLNRPEETLRLPVSDIIFAGGFYEPKPGPAPEFGAHSHPDILSAMAFEAWTAEFNAAPAAGLFCPSDKRPVRSVAFIQCAGARDKRYLAHCSAVCCMHAAKQAAWMKRRRPDLELTVFYTDLRAPGKGQEAYMRAASEAGVRMLRRRPGLVAPVSGPQGSGIAVRHEWLGNVVTTLADVVVLNGGLACCPWPEQGPEQGAPAPKRTIPADRLCGFCLEPADIAHSVIQGGQAAVLARLRRTAKSNGAGDRS